MTFNNNCLTDLMGNGKQGGDSFRHGIQDHKHNFFTLFQLTKTDLQLHLLINEWKLKKKKMITVWISI